jgi:hypothetical protein
LAMELQGRTNSFGEVSRPVAWELFQKRFGQCYRLQAYTWQFCERALRCVATF